MAKLFLSCLKMFLNVSTYVSFFMKTLARACYNKFKKIIVKRPAFAQNVRVWQDWHNCSYLYCLLCLFSCMREMLFGSCNIMLMLIAVWLAKYCRLSHYNYYLFVLLLCFLSHAPVPPNFPKSKIRVSISLYVFLIYEPGTCCWCLIYLWSDNSS